MTSQKKILQYANRKTLTNEQRQQLLMLLKNTGSDMPDLAFENAYISYQNNPSTNLSKTFHKIEYVKLEEIVYMGLELKLPVSTLKKYVGHFRKFLGDNTYIRRLTRFIQYMSNSEPDPSPLEDLIQEDRTDNQSVKKSLAGLKKEGKITEFIQRINKYLSIEPLDEEAWLELAEIYAEKGHYMKSAFCYEELILINPTNDIYTLKLSELYLTLGNKNTSQKAIKYLSYLITKRPDNIRALWILYRALIGQQQYAELRENCNNTLNKIYSKNNEALKIHVAL